jgi:Tol biopolymer transport system component/DNA-binding winged helix-turn-helix (wHTH) protein
MQPAGSRDVERYHFGSFVLDAGHCELRRNGTPVPLPGKAFDLLLTLVRAADRTVTKGELMSVLWRDTAVEESNLTQTVFVLRKALGEDNEEAGYIRTVPRRGYRFVAPVAAEGSVKPAEIRTLSNSEPRSRTWLYAAGAVLAIGVAATGYSYLRLRLAVSLDLSTYRYRPFAFTQEFERAGTWSPDGKSIAFLRGRDDQNVLSRGLSLVVQPVDGSVATELAERVVYGHLAWSPDGTRIYFRKPGGIYTVSGAGGEPELVFKDTAFIASIDLSPNGKSLAIWRAPRSADGKVRGSLWISSPPGAQPREYTPVPVAVPAALSAIIRFSPDGKWIYLNATTLNGNQAEIWLLPFPMGSGTPRRVFSKMPWGRVEAAWLPDSRRLVLSGTLPPATIPSLWLADTRDESITKMTDGSVRQETPAVSPDGRSILFTRVEGDADIVELPLDGSAPRKLLATSTAEYSPGWSSKGDAFAYLTQRNGSTEMWLRSASGDWERPIVTGKDFPAIIEGLGAPVISPDGTRIVYTALLRDAKRLGAIYISPISGGAPAWVADGGAPSWSPDGASLALLTRGGKLATVRVGASQPPLEISDVNCTPPLPVWSPSGNWIACQTAVGAYAAQEGVTGVALVSADGTTTRTLPQLKAAVIAWSKDSRTIYGLHDEDGRWSMLAEDVASGAIRKVADYGFEITPFSGNNFFNMRMSLSPDGKSFTIGTLKSQTDLWILEGFPR